MRSRRMVLNDTAIYHCMSRTVNGEAFFQKREKERMRKMIKQVADFSGVEVLTYCIMHNHFHVLVRVAPIESLPDAELLRRFRVLYPNPTDYQALTSEDLERVLKENGERAEALRAQLLRRMGDVSEFMKTLKQRFSLWYNKTNERYGPVWSDRFKSVLVEGRGFPLQTVAAYIDLNPVRAGLVEDPKDYRFCGYAAAVAGDAEARAGIQFLSPDMHTLSLADSMQAYRQLLFGKGSSAVVGKAGISGERAKQVLEAEQGDISMADLLFCRMRYFSEGVVLGSNEFILSHLEEWQRKRLRKHPPKVHGILDGADGADELACMNGYLRKTFS